MEPWSVCAGQGTALGMALRRGIAWIMSHEDCVLKACSPACAANGQLVETLVSRVNLEEVGSLWNVP